jgi:predicted TIM-barrel fold metal-dependent hydrolase
MHSKFWDPLFAACEETDTVVNQHVGSSSRPWTTARDAPYPVVEALAFQGSMHAMIDWLTTGVLERFPTFRIAISEGQVGWMPFVLQRLDNGWKFHWRHAGITDVPAVNLPRPPSTYVPGRIFGCIYDDLLGLKSRDTIGMDHIMFETDFPHGDSTWPKSMDVAAELVEGAGLDEHETWQFLRGNAISCYRLDRYGIHH